MDIVEITLFMNWVTVDIPPVAVFLKLSALMANEQKIMLTG
jgi:hypothetical protein